MERTIGRRRVLAADHKNGREERVEREPLAGEQAHRRRTPKRRSGIEAPDVQPSLKITPAPRKPMPETTWAAIRAAPSSSNTTREYVTKIAAPSATSAFVLKPARRWRDCRSKPIAAPKQTATKRFNAVCANCIVMMALRELKRK